MVHKQWNSEYVRRIRLSVWTIIPTDFYYKTIKGGGGGNVHKYPHKVVNGFKIQDMGTTHCFSVRQDVLLDVSYHFVKKNLIYPLSP